MHRHFVEESSTITSNGIGLALSRRSIPPYGKHAEEFFHSTANLVNVVIVTHRFYRNGA
jgi:hypothetical protein